MTDETPKADPYGDDPGEWTADSIKELAKRIVSPTWTDEREQKLKERVREMDASRIHSKVSAGAIASAGVGALLAALEAITPGALSALGGWAAPVAVLVSTIASFARSYFRSTTDADLPTDIQKRIMSRAQEKQQAAVAATEEVSTREQAKELIEEIFDDPEDAEAAVEFVNGLVDLPGLNEEQEAVIIRQGLQLLIFGYESLA